jgi:hypothetical protein
MSPHSSCLGTLVLLGFLVSSHGPIAQKGDLLSGLASGDPEVRARSTRALTNREPGDWLIRDLDRAVNASAEVRQRFLAALGKNRALFPRLVREYAKGDGRSAWLASCLVASFHANRLPTPIDPTGVEVLPSTPLDLHGMRSLVDCWDRMLVAGDFGLPWILDPRLDREGAAGRQSLDVLSGAYTIRELLPPIELAGWPTRPGEQRGLVTRIRPEGIFVTAANGPTEMADFFLACLDSYLGADSQAGERASLCLAALDLPGVGVLFVEDVAEIKNPRRKRALLGLVGEWHRGRSPLPAEKIGPELLKLYRGDQRWSYVTGCCLRELLMHKGALASWYGEPQQRWSEDPLDALLLAGLRVPSLGPWLEEQLLAVLADDAPMNKIRTASLLDALARLEGPLPGKLREVLARRVLHTGLRMGEVVLAQALDLLSRRGGDWLPRAALSISAVGDSRAEGRLWAQQLAKMGQRGWWVCIETLVAAQSVNAALLELASAPAPIGDPPAACNWTILGQLEKGRTPVGLQVPAGSEAVFLMDVGFHLLRSDGGRGRNRWKPATDCFDRLQGQIVKRTVDQNVELAQAMGSSLGRLLLKLPRGPQGKRAGQWLGGWLADSRTREMGLSASIVCLRKREHLLGDIDASMTNGLPPLEAVMLRRRVVLASRGRPAELGQDPVDPTDPLLLLRR